MTRERAQRTLATPLLLAYVLNARGARIRLGATLNARSIGHVVHGPHRRRTVLVDVTAPYPRGQLRVVYAAGDAGLTTLARILGGDMRATSGAITIDEHGPPEPGHLRYLEWPVTLPAGSTARGHLRNIAQRGGWPPSAAKRVVRDALRITGLDPLADYHCAELRRLEQSQVAALAEILHAPGWLWLDEPDTKVCSGSERAELVRFLRLLAEVSATGIGITTRNIDVALAVKAGHWARLAKGRLHDIETESAPLRLVVPRG